MRDTAVTETTDAGAKFADITVHIPMIFADHVGRIAFVCKWTTDPRVLALTFVLLEIFVGDLYRTTVLIRFRRRFLVFIKFPVIVILTMNEKR